jgi:hypothetical protein
MELARPAIALITRGLLLGIKYHVERLPMANPTGPQRAVKTG